MKHINTVIIVAVALAVFAIAAGPYFSTIQVRTAINNLGTLAQTGTSVFTGGATFNGSVTLGNVLYQDTCATPAPTVGASAFLSPPTRGDIIYITGTGEIDTIATLGYNGRLITLIFASTVHVPDSANMKLSAALNSTADDVLKLVCYGAYWYEVARSVN